MTTTYRTVNIYDPDNVERVISFVIVSQNASGLALRYECTLDSDGRGSVSLPCNYRYEIRRPNSLTHANLPLSIAPISLIDWIGISARDAIPTALADLDTSVTGAELDADHATIGGLGTMATESAAAYVTADGNTPLTGDWDAGAHEIIAKFRFKQLGNKLFTNPSNDLSWVSQNEHVTNSVSQLLIKNIGTGGIWLNAANASGAIYVSVNDVLKVLVEAAKITHKVNTEIEGSLTATSLVSDTIAEDTADAGVTVDGLLIKDGDIPETAVTAHEAALEVTLSQVSDAGTMATKSADDYAELSTQNTFTQPNSIQISTADDGGDGWRVMKRGTTGDATAAVVDNAELGYASFYGWHGSDYARGGYFLFRAIENWSGSAQGTRLEISLTDEGATTTNVPIAAEGKFVLIKDKLKFINIAATTNHVVGAISGGNTYAQDSAIADIQFVTDDSTWYYGKIVFRTANVDGTNPAYPPTERMRITASGRVGIGASSPSAQLHIDQASSTAAIPVLTLDQADVDEPAIKIIGTAAAADLTRTIVAEADVTTATRAGFVKVEVQDDGNQITDQDYYMPVYTLA